MIIKGTIFGLVFLCTIQSGATYINGPAGSINFFDFKDAFVSAPHKMETNLYGYSFQDPVNFIDPEGTTAYLVCYTEAHGRCVNKVVNNSINSSNSCDSKNGSSFSAYMGTVKGAFACVVEAANACAQFYYNEHNPPIIKPDRGT